MTNNNDSGLRILFENTATFITAIRGDGQIDIRCNFKYTDCGDDETLCDFIARHGGVNETVSYLHEAYERAGK